VRHRRGEGHRLRAEIIAAATGLLERSGTEEAISLRAVANAAGIATTSIYLHFDDREALLWAVAESQFGELDGLMAASDPDAAPIERLRAAALAYCRFGLERPGPYRIMFGATRTPKQHRDFDDLPGAAAFERLHACVRELAPDESFATTTAIWAALHGIVSLRATMQHFPWQSVAELVDVVIYAHCGERSAASDTAPGT
jgi:AcrR family transcriptional regulator